MGTLFFAFHRYLKRLGEFQIGTHGDIWFCGRDVYYSYLLGMNKIHAVVLTTSDSTLNFKNSCSPQALIPQPQWIFCLRSLIRMLSPWWLIRALCTWGDSVGQYPCHSFAVQRGCSQPRAPAWHCPRAPGTRTLLPPFGSSEPCTVGSRLVVPGKRQVI